MLLTDPSRLPRTPQLSTLPTGMHAALRGFLFAILTMPVIQREFEAGSFHVANDAPFQDESLSWEAKGVLGYLFSKPPDWTPRMYDIVQSGPCEKHKIKSVFKELEEHGYMQREKYRTEDGTFDWRVTLYDHPRHNPGWTESTPESDHPGRNGGASNTDSQSKLNTNNTESTTAATHARENSAFDVEENSVHAITEGAFGEPVRGLATKEQINMYCERAGPEGWDCLRAVCDVINEKGWNPTAALVKKKLTQQLQMLSETDEPDEPDDFDAKARRIWEAAGRGAGVDGF